MTSFFLHLYSGVVFLPTSMRAWFIAKLKPKSFEIQLTLDLA